MSYLWWHVDWTWIVSVEWIFTSGIICIVLVSGSIFRCIGKLSAADSESIARNGRNLHSFFTRIVRLLYQLLGFDRIFMLGKMYNQAIGSKIVHMLNEFWLYIFWVLIPLIIHIYWFWNTEIQRIFWMILDK